jgi:hypothetical protein
MNDGFTTILGNQWYILYPCFNSNLSVLFTKQTEIGQYVNGTVAIYDWYNPQSIFGCYTIKAFSGTPPSYATINNNLVWDDSLCQPCQTYCVTISGGSGYVKYINNQNVETTTSLPAKICTKTKPFVSTPSPIIKLIPADCSNNCEIECYKLTNCKTGQIIHSNSAPLFTPFSGNKIVELYEYEGCWSIDIGEDCECLVDVTVKTSYADCETCLPIVAYRLVNCEDDNQIKYTQQDLLIYVDKVVTLDCGECWIVEQIDFKPPSVQNIVITYTYDTCEECSRAYWILYDCDGELEPITTYSDMTPYTGSVLRLVGYPSCWTVQSSPTPDFANALEVVVSKQFEECTDCLAATACKCTRVTSLLTEGEASFTYIDCFDNSHTVTLEAEEISAKFCSSRFTNISSDDFEVKYTGECIDNPNATNSKVCPVDIKGRFIKPGYKAPTSNPDRFERITCETAEVLYKQVLQQRYGISNCCPEEDENFIIKKELIDLESLNDPEFDCPLPSCCAPAECGCTNCIS